MHEFCPLCLKNGIKIKIRSFQLNFQEAVFMCATEKCTWPIGYEDLTFMNRPVGKEWSNTWDESALKYIRNEHDLLFEFSSYTPPQTPSNETVCKDVSNYNPTYSTSVPDKVFNSIPMLTQENVNQSQELCSILSDPSELSIDSSINHTMNVKPKIVLSKSVNYTLERFQAQGYTSRKPKEKNNAPSKLEIELNSHKTNTNIPTSLASNSISLKNDKLNNTLSTLHVIKVRSKDGLRLLSSKKKKICPYEKFDFNKLMKPKSTNEEKIHEVNEHKIDEKEENSILALNEKVKKYSCNKIHSNKLLNSQTENANNKLYNGNSADINKTNIESNNSAQVDLNSILGLSNSCKDSGVDQDLTEKDELDLHLDELLSVFSDELNSTVKNDVNDAEEFEWINSLLE